MLWLILMINRNLLEEKIDDYEANNNYLVLTFRIRSFSQSNLVLVN
jgi:hypothetical protein